MRSASSNSFVSRIWHKQVPPKRCVALWPWWIYILSIFRIQHQWTNATRIWCNIMQHLSMLGFCPLLQEKPLGPNAFGLAASPRKQFQVDWQRDHRIKMKMAASCCLFLIRPTKIHPLLLIRSCCPFWGCGWGLLWHSSGLCQTCSLDRITADPGTLWKQLWNSLQEVHLSSPSRHTQTVNTFCMLVTATCLDLNSSGASTKPKSDEKETLFSIAPCYSYCIWLITPAFCSLKHGRL